MADPAVSVVVPFLDTPKAFFEEAIASVEAQTFRDWEIVLVNDGSGPEATAVAAAFVARSPDRIRCLSHPGGVNRGIPASRNLGVAHARGAYVCFLDSDDVWLPHKLEEQVRALDDAPEAAMVFGRSVWWRSWADAPDRGSRDVVPALGVRDRTLLRPPSFLHAVLRRKVLVPCPSDILVRAVAIADVGGFDEHLPNMFEDQRFYVKIGLAAPVLAVDRVWDRYRIHPASVLQSVTRAQHRRDRSAFLDWVLQYTEQQGHRDRALRRTLAVDRLATSIPGGMRVMRSVRRALTFPGRLLAGLTGR